MKYICRIGKNLGNDVVIQDRTVDDFHAQLIIDAENTVWIKDLDSKFGVWVNNERVTKRELFAEDEVRIGFSVISWREKALEWINLEHPKLETENQIQEKQEQKEEKQVLEFQQDSISRKLALKASGALEPEYNRMEFEEGLPKEAESKKQQELNDLPKQELEETNQERDTSKQALDLPKLEIDSLANLEANNSSSAISDSASTAPIGADRINGQTSLNSKSQSSLNPSDLKLIAYVLLGLALMVILGWFLASLG